MPTRPASISGISRWSRLDHVVALTLAVVHEIDDDRVAFARRPVLGGDERGGGVAQQLEL
jgi:hypothetical protein